MEIVKQHFEESAPRYDRLIVSIVPGYAEMLRALIAAFPFQRSAAFRVLDLGCGTGTTTEHVLQTFPNAHVTCVDLAENMVATARVKLARYPSVQFLVSDCTAFDFAEPYDAIVSSLVLHHLPTDQDKKRFYRQIYSGVASGGIFYNADLVMGSSPFLHEAYMHHWREFINQNLANDKEENEWVYRHLTEDRPSKLMDQLQWLAEFGFTDIDVIWKNYSFAVYGGAKG